MRESNKNAPYTFKEAPGEHRFSLKFEPLQSFLPRARHLHSIVSQFPAFQAEAIVPSLACRCKAAKRLQTTKSVDSQVAEVIDKREQSITFDPSWLVNLSEKILLETKVHKITPLVSTPARVMLTDVRLYLQPLNNIDPEPVQNMQMKNLQKDDDPFRMYTRKWQEGELSNYDYLMLLNHRAGRTVNDITQYPVFPWIIADYQSSTLDAQAAELRPVFTPNLFYSDLKDPKTFRDLSKPIGALNPRRLESFKERYRDMPEPRFLYGTHYSTPGYVLYYLVRAAPEYMLRLQNGKFDAPDRMFHSIADTWNNALNLPADVKELIPEFYNMPDFLLNTESLYLGVRSNGEMLGDVVLPPWANGPRDFVTKMRQALESDYVSENLHKWIDLIFGYKQRGAEAIAADNAAPPPRPLLSSLFSTFSASFSGSSRTTSPHKTLPSMMRSASGTLPITSSSNNSYSGPLSPSSNGHPLAQTLSSSAGWEWEEVLSHSPVGLSPSLVDSSPALEALKKEELLVPVEALRFHDVEEIPVEIINLSPSVGQDEPMRSPMPSPGAGGGRPSASWDRLLELPTHSSYRLHRDVISSVCVSIKDNRVYSASQDGTFKVWDIREERQLRSTQISDLALSSCCLHNNDAVVMLGSWDNNIYVYSVDHGR
ncbi:Beige/BEACH domain containing protein, partial [Acanthamoeba castellanii str. Neff]